MKNLESVNHTYISKQEGEGKALSYNRMSTNECKRNNVNKKLPFGSPQYDG